MIRLQVFFLVVTIFSCCSLTAQGIRERLNNEISVYSTIGTDRNQAFWLTHNRFGMFDDASANALTMLSSELRVNKEKIFDIGGGIDVVARASEGSSIYLHQAYIEAKTGFLYFNAGRMESTHGITFGELSSGSMGISRNAMPIPKVSAYVPDFQEVPYSFGWLEFKGHFAHGWLENERFASNAYFHDKSAYLQTGGNSGFKLYLGLVHMAIWGGESPRHGPLPSGLSDFISVTMAKGGDEDAPTGDQLNALGFHTGVWDWGLKADLGETDLHIYYQHNFTDHSGQTYKNKADGLWGLGISNPFSSSYITGLLYEVLYTKHQSGPGLSDPGPHDWPPFCEQPNCGFPYGGRDNYYNNGVYRSGHSYYGMSIGTPFFLTDYQLNKVDPDARTYSSQFFVSNRNVAHHFGMNGIISENLSYRLLTSYVQYFGTYQGLNLGQTFGYFDPANDPEEYFFNPAQKQWYFMLETKWGLRKTDNIEFTVTLAADKGDLFNNIGIMAGVSWDIGAK